MIFFIVVVLILGAVLWFFKWKEEVKAMVLLKDNLEDARRIKDYMFKITHEVKNPLAVCKGYLDMLNPNDIGKTIKYVNLIKNEMDRALTVLSDAMDYDKVVIDIDIMDVVLLFEEVIESYKDLLKGKDIKIKYVCKYEELFILGDYNRLKQVVVNLLRNAIESKRNGEQLLITFKINVFKDKLNIVVKDNGSGMNEEVLNNIGIDFFTTKKTGSGLGVSISKDIVNKHGGELLYESGKNKGTTANIMLPINCKL